MKHPILIHGAWTLLAAGAYFAGTFYPRGGSGTSSSSVTGALRDPLVSREAALQNGNAKSDVAGGSGEAVRWLDSFRGRDGVISAERMTEAVQGALRDPDPVKSTLYFAQLLKELTAENAPAALKAVRESGGGPDSMRFLGLLAHAWGEKDGKAAIAAFDALRGREGEVGKSTAMAAWATTDPDAAMKWLQERNAQKDPKADPRQDSALSRGMLSGLARRDVDVALKYLMTLNEGQQGDFVGLLAEQKMKESIAAGAEWAERLPNDRMRTNAFEVVGGQFLRRDLDGALQWAEKIAGRPDAHEAVADVANELAGKNPQQAAAWVSKLPAGPSQDHAFEDVFETWTRSDPLAASQSLSAMNQGPGRDAAIQAFSKTLARENPADAMAWASAMTDPKGRIDVQIDIARRWQAAAPTEAQAWITANLPPDLQARALAPRVR